MGDVARRARLAADLVTRHFPDAAGDFRRVLSALVARAGWRCLVRTGQGGVDVFAVGRGGVLAVVIGEHLPDHDAARALLAEAEHAFAGVRVSGRVVAPPRLVAIRPGSSEARSRADGLYQAVREADLEKFFASTVGHLTKTHVRAITDAVRLPDFALLTVAERTAPEAAAGLLDADELREDQVASAMSGSFQSWLTFLHPSQSGIVTRRYSGPARIGGPAGTGKTVVALHRLRAIARRTTGPLLFTTFVRTLPAVHRESFLRLAPELADRVEFTGLHAWAHRLLRQRGVTVSQHGSARSVFNLAWVAHRSALEPVEPREYWWTEIDTVVKGRGIRTFDEYAPVPRPGRVRKLSTAQKEAVWALYETYQDKLAERGLLDFNDLVQRAWEELDGEDPPYAAVVADEVQDISLMGLRLLHRLAGDGPDGLLLVGDGQQQVYPGGWKLSEAGISMRGRGAVLKVNYRNRADIVRFADGLGAVDAVDDLDGGAGVSLRDAEVVSEGGVVRMWRGERADLGQALRDALRGTVAPSGSTAVIVLGKVGDVVAALRGAGVASTPLKEYAGLPDDSVKVGTVHRAKGLEFQAVIAVHFESDGAGADREERELRARQLMVAATRARDELWWFAVRG
jgi:hypothetical protein